ncbi:MAG: sulfotransferase [Sandaracinaceae bacterium]|nr:sulfotransferase [Sandaracinaceae bacterium]
MKRLVIAGMPRCGTTLLATLLDSQPGCFFLTDYLPAFHEAKRRLRVGWQTALSLPQRRVALAIARDQLLRMRHPLLLGPDRFRTLDELHRLVLEDMCGASSIVAGHKVVLDAPDVRELLRETDVHVVICYRDPRDAALSYWHRVGGGVESYLETYKRMIALVLERPSPRLFAIRYETLAEDREHALASLAATLGLTLWAPTELSFHPGPKGRVEWSGNSAFEDGNSQERWRGHEQSRIVRYAAHVCAAEIGTLGYAPGPALSARERARWARQRWVTRADRRASDLFTRGLEAIRRRFAPELEH